MDRIDLEEDESRRGPRRIVSGLTPDGQFVRQEVRVHWTELGIDGRPNRPYYSVLHGCYLNEEPTNSIDL
jgi:hypothetical protein